MPDNAPFKNVLCIDTSYGNGMVALIHGDKIEEIVNQDQREQASLIVSNIDTLCTKANLDKKDLEALIVSQGPGSYTGIRIGLAAAQGLSKGLNIPIFGVSNFELLSSYITQSLGCDGAFGIVINSMRSDSYIQVFSSDGQAFTDMMTMEDEHIEGFVKEYNVLNIYSNKMEILSNHINNEGIRLVGMENISGACFSAYMIRGKFLRSNEKIEPIYLKAPDVSKSKKVFVSLK